MLAGGVTAGGGVPVEHVKFVFATTEPEKVIGKTNFTCSIGFPPGGVPMLAGGVTAGGGVPVEPDVGVEGPLGVGEAGVGLMGVAADGPLPAAPGAPGMAGMTLMAFGLPELQPKPAMTTTKSSARELVLRMFSNLRLTAMIRLTSSFAI